MNPRHRSDAIAIWATSPAAHPVAAVGDRLRDDMDREVEVTAVTGPHQDDTGSWWIVAGRERNRRDRPGLRVIAHLRRGMDGLVRTPSALEFLPIPAGSDPVMAIPEGLAGTALLHDPFHALAGVPAGCGDAVEDRESGIPGVITGVRGAWVRWRDLDGRDRVACGGHLVHRQRQLAYQEAHPEWNEDGPFEHPTLGGVLGRIEAILDQDAAPVVGDWTARVKEACAQTPAVPGIIRRALLREEAEALPPVSRHQAQVIAEHRDRLLAAVRVEIQGAPVAISVDESRDGCILVTPEAPGGRAATPVLASKWSALSEEAVLGAIAGMISQGTPTTAPPRPRRVSAAKERLEWQAAVAAIPDGLRAHPAVAAVLERQGETPLSVAWAREELDQALSQARAGLRQAIEADLDALLASPTPLTPAATRRLEDRWEEATGTLYDERLRALDPLGRITRVVDHGDGWWSTFIADDGTYGGISSTGYFSLVGMGKPGFDEQDADATEPPTPEGVLAHRHTAFLATLAGSRSRDPNDRSGDLLARLGVLWGAEDPRVRALAAAPLDPAGAALLDQALSINQAWADTLGALAADLDRILSALAAGAATREQLVQLQGWRTDARLSGSPAGLWNLIGHLERWVRASLATTWTVVDAEGAPVVLHLEPQDATRDAWRIAGESGATQYVPAQAPAILGHEQVAALVLRAATDAEPLRQALRCAGLVPEKGRAVAAVEEEEGDPPEEDDGGDGEDDQEGEGGDPGDDHAIPGEAGPVPLANQQPQARARTQAPGVRTPGADAPEVATPPAVDRQTTLFDTTPPAGGRQTTLFDAA